MNNRRPELTRLFTLAGWTRQHGDKGHSKNGHTRPVRTKALCRFEPGVLLAMGMFSVWWGVSTFPIFWRDALWITTAHSIINGEQFKREILQTSRG